MKKSTSGAVLLRQGSFFLLLMAGLTVMGEPEALSPEERVKVAKFFRDKQWAPCRPGESQGGPAPIHLNMEVL